MRNPGVFYRLVGRLNWLIWRMPFPRRVLVRLSTTAYRNPPMSLDAVLEIVDALEHAGLRFWLWGGWGVDALAGGQSRVHRDLDLVIHQRDERAVTEALRPLGYYEWYRIQASAPLHARHVLHDHDLAGRAIDLHPVDLTSERLPFSVGNLAGRAIPCLALDLQLSTHTGYRPARRDRLDMAILRRVLTRPVSALIVPVPVANDLVHDSAVQAGMPAHITVLYPFIPAREIDAETEAALAALFEPTPSFRFTLARTGRFPNVLYLAPEPEDQFVELCRAVQQRWPEYAPYGGAYGEPVPHLTLAYGDVVPAGLEQSLPIHTTATEVWLMIRTPGSWVPRARFALGRVPEGTAQYGVGTGAG